MVVLDACARLLPKVDVRRLNQQDPHPLHHGVLRITIESLLFLSNRSWALHGQGDTKDGSRRSGFNQTLPGSTTKNPRRMRWQCSSPAFPAHRLSASQIDAMRRDSGPWPVTTRPFRGSFGKPHMCYC
jgi:hypothetical protein